MSDIIQLKAHGKLLLTGEYAVLDGALALAAPTKQGQRLRVETRPGTGLLHWESIEMHGHTWFGAQFDARDFSVKSTQNEAVSGRLQQLLQYIAREKPSFLAHPSKDTFVTITAEFPLDWGLGSSSTLVALLAQWAEVDPFHLLANSFGGSGYDVACAFADAPIVFRRLEDYEERVERFNGVFFEPTFANQLYFVYLGKKQDSREGIARYRTLVKDNSQILVSEITDITSHLLDTPTLTEFEALLMAHEVLISKALGLTRAQELHFPDYPGVIKSLGAWGGDFVLATDANGHAPAWFAERGFGTCVPYLDMIHQPYRQV